MILKSPRDLSGMQKTGVVCDNDLKGRAFRFYEGQCFLFCDRLAYHLVLVNGAVM